MGTSPGAVELATKLKDLSFKTADQAVELIRLHQSGAMRCCLDRLISESIVEFVHALTQLLALAPLLGQLVLHLGEQRSQLFERCALRRRYGRISTTEDSFGSCGWPQNM